MAMLWVSGILRVLCLQNVRGDVFQKAKVWNEKARLEVDAIVGFQPWLLHGNAPVCELGDYDAGAIAQLLQAWLGAAEDREKARHAFLPIMRATRAPHALAQCPSIFLPARILQVEEGLRRAGGPRDQLLAELIVAFASFAEMVFLLGRLRDSIPKYWTSVTQGTTHLSLQRVFARLRNWFTYAMRPYSFSTDNNCAGQWCFFEPCEAFCPVELCYDSRIDWAACRRL